MKLLKPVILGKQTLQNTMVMAPMTRSRADIDGVVSDLTTLYYTQRASAGLLITEAVNISEQALGSPLTPGLYTAEQIDAWKKVTQSVHEKGGVIYAQLWHTGRVGHSVDRNGKLPVAPSAVGIKGQQHFTSQGMKDYEVPHELTTEEIKQIVKDYGKAAKNAIEAGFDGVELHAAFGYLPNQFLSESANLRTDEYGGNVENRNRFVLEVMHELVNAVGNDKAGIKLSPTIYYNNIENSDPEAQFKPLIQALNELPLAYIHLMNAMFPLDNHPNYPKNVIETFGSISKHSVIANAGYNKESGEAELEKGIAKMISYGLLFIANPDLPKRFELDAELSQPDQATMYGGGEHGYTDYPFLD
ncbi:N-ethylmaleimide reductase [Chryseobacterium ginsenosidimutans]|uniref:alkene reductase n=1 Tax=Chryseobacterium ginsenosidimutans TaxID=687846 RepID=UPI00278AE611|nr:alkene reductase [Chryseobacterium ginsenosidimutans]MDQ0593599.1 N-ethylmaleimide reductase [Chryseobacterium ginsenosidimutans]